MDVVGSAMERAFLVHRAALLTFLYRLGAGEEAEDILQEMWTRLPDDSSQIQSPRPYLFRMANSLVIDHARSRSQGILRERSWLAATGPAIPDRCEQPLPDRALEAEQVAAKAFEVIAAEGARAARVFRRHRIDGLSQREVAAELGVSIGTVEGDLRRAYRALLDLRESLNKE